MKLRDLELTSEKGLPSSDTNTAERQKKAKEEGYGFILSKEVNLTALDRYNSMEDYLVLKDLKEGKSLPVFLFAYSEEALDLLRPLPYLEFLGGYDAIVIDMGKCLWNSMSDNEAMVFGKLSKESKKPVLVYLLSAALNLEFLLAMEKYGIDGIIVNDDDEEKTKAVIDSMTIPVLVEKDGIIRKP